MASTHTTAMDVIRSSGGVTAVVKMATLDVVGFEKKIFSCIRRAEDGCVVILDINIKNGSNI